MEVITHMFNKVVALALLVMFSISSVAFAAGQEMTILDKVNATEKFFYGTEQTGALLERVNKLNREVYGEESRDSLAAKVDTLYSNIKNKSLEEPSFLLRLNAMEWALNHNVTNQPAKNRLENVEHTLFGNASDGAFEPRIEKLLKVAYADGRPNLNVATLPKDMLVKIKLLSAVGTKTSRPGDRFSYQASQDIYSNGILIVAQGAVGAGKVVKVEEAKNFGRDGELELSFDAIEAIDGTAIPIMLGDKAKEENKSLATAAGASIAGMAILGPVGIVGGAFVHGKEINIPAGTEFYVQSKNEVEIIGLQVK